MARFLMWIVHTILCGVLVHGHITGVVPPRKGLVRRSQAKELKTRLTYHTIEASGAEKKLKTDLSSKAKASLVHSTIESDGQGQARARGETLAPCGFSIDCPQDYSLADVQQMADSQLSNSDVHEAALKQLHQNMRKQCENSRDMKGVVLADGGWCYDKLQSKALIFKQQQYIDKDFYLPAHHVLADSGFAEGVAKLLKKSDGSLYSLTDLGAGVGQFGHVLKARLPQLEYYGYDGAGNVEEFTDHYVQFADLTKPLSLHRTDWVLSSEVGEHIPHKFESQVIANLHAHNCKGIILTWAVLNQGGNGHVNCHSNEYLLKIFIGLGYKLNEDATTTLRAAATTSPWLQHSSMVLERTAKPDGCQ